MNYITALYTRLRSLLTGTASAASKAITVAIKVDAEDALATLESLAARVREFESEVKSAMEAAELLEAKLASWAELKAKSIAADTIKVADHAVLDVESVYADGEKLAVNVVDAIKATEATAVDATKAVEAIPADIATIL